MSQTGFESDDSIVRRVEVGIVPITFHFEGETLFTTIEGPTPRADVTLA